MANIHGNKFSDETRARMSQAHLARNERIRGLEAENRELLARLEAEKLLRERAEAHVELLIEALARKAAA